MATMAPKAAKSCAMARPRPRDAPVTNAVLPSRKVLMLLRLPFSDAGVVRPLLLCFDCLARLRRALFQRVADFVPPPHSKGTLDRRETRFQSAPSAVSSYVLQPPSVLHCTVI